jgi:hypothetical protein
MTTVPSPATETIEHLLSLERERCRAVLGGSREGLRHLIHPGLRYVHSSGKVDSFDSYFAPASKSTRFSKAERFDDLRVMLVSGAALMTGKMLLEGTRLSSGEPFRVLSQVMQIWQQEGGRWLMLGFQATPLGDA